MKILIVQTSFLGDTILSTPVVGGIKQVYPDAELWMMTTPLSSQLVMRDPLLAGVIPFDKRKKDAGFKGLFAMAERIRNMKFDLALALHRSYRTSALLWLAKIPMRIGFKTADLSFLYHKTFSRDPAEHDVIRNLAILKNWGPPASFQGDMRLFAPDISEIGEATRTTLPVSPYAVVCPGSVGKTKRWHPEGFKKTARYLMDKGYRVVLLGGQDDVPVSREVAEGLDVIDLSGKTSISDAIYVVQQAKLMVCNDSMTLHMASALKIPTVAIFCATTTDLGFGPWRNNSRIVEKKLDCRPCNHHGRRHCPAGTYACMNEVDFNDVTSAINAVLEIV